MSSLEKFARTFTPDDVANFLARINLPQYSDKFKDVGISGELLLESGIDVLYELGVKNALHQMLIMEHFRRELTGDTAKYSVEHVKHFLKKYNLEKYGPNLESNGIDGDMLLNVEENLMKSVLNEVGVLSRIDRIKIRTWFKTFISQNPSILDKSSLLELARKFTSDDVAAFMTRINLSQYHDILRDMAISGELLLEAKQDMLFELGVINPLHQMKIMELFRRELTGDTAKYSTEHVKLFLTEYKLEKYGPNLESNGIDGDMLLKVEEKLMKSVLNEVGILSCLDQIKIRIWFKTFISKLENP